MNIKTLDEQFFRQSQSWYYIGIFRYTIYDKVLFKVDICRNASDRQSYINGYLFSTDNNQWNKITSKPIYNSHCSKVSYVHNDPDINLFRTDAQEVVELLKKIAGCEYVEAGTD